MSDIIRMTQFRKIGCADWYDGSPDHKDGRGPYETRAIFMLDMAANRATENGRLLRMSEALAAENASLKALVAEMAKGLEDTLEIAARNEMGDYATRALALIARAKETQ